jgi:RNA polymerase sigma factor (sigma-70 family)
MASEDVRTDARLLKDSVRDANAFGLFYDRHAKELAKFFIRRTADHALAADLTSETFAQAFANRRRYRDTGGPATGWLYTIASRQLNEYFRQQRVSAKYRDRLGVATSTAPEDFDRVDNLDELQGRLAGLADAVAGLSAGLAEAVTLRVGHGWSYQRLGDHLGCSPAAARVRVSRALTDLELRLNPAYQRSSQ